MDSLGVGIAKYSYWINVGADVDELSLSREMSIMPVDMAKTGVAGRVILVILLLPSPKKNMFQSDSNLVVECSIGHRSI